MANEGDWQVTDQDIREHVEGILAGDEDELRESVENLLQNARRKTAEINLWTRECRAKQEALQRIHDAIHVRAVRNHPEGAWSSCTLLEMRAIAQNALDWKARENE